MAQDVKVLIVEDNEDDYELTKALLPSQGIDLVWAQSLSDALKACNENNFNAIMLDFGLPDSQGLSTFDQLVAPLDTVPAVIVFTGNDDEELAQEALNRGAQDYIVKGHVTSELLTRSLKYAIERDKVDKQLRKQNEELLALNADLTLARDIAIDASRLKSEFLANISHEIRTPLSGIVSIAELLVDETDQEMVKELHVGLQQSAKRLYRTVSELLDFSKLESGKMTLNNVECNIRGIIEEVIQSIKPTAKRKKLDITANFSQALPTSIIVDEVRLKQIVLNFAHNAVKFTDNGAILIDVQPAPNNQICIQVKDTGIGIPHHAMRSIFEPFVQADGSTTRRYEGTGLGLAISQKSAQLLGGSVGVESVEGKGTTFWVNVPIGQA